MSKPPDLQGCQSETRFRPLQSKRELKLEMRFHLADVLDLNLWHREQ